MKKFPAKTAIPGMRSWQDIAQRAAGRALSPVAWRKQFVRNFGMGSAILLALAITGLGAWALWAARPSTEPARAALDHSVLRHVDFTTDGVLSADWARSYLGLRDGDALEQYDIFTLRQRLLASKQVNDAVVERALPDTLRIRVTERRPWARIAAADRNRGFKPYLVARDGTVYEGQDYPAERFNFLPWLAGVTLHRAPDGGFAPVAGMDAVADLLTAARGSLPQLAAQWTVVDLGQYNSSPTAPLSLLKVRSRNLGELVFLAGNYATQIDRLAIVSRALLDRPTRPARLDLSLDNQVVVEPATLALAPVQRQYSYR
jgi:hypothetical protein